MTEQTKTDDQVMADYDRFDTNFRTEKKRGNFTVASQWKAKRDALDAQVTEIIKRRHSQKG